MRYFYHSFPRRNHTQDRGIRVLNSIIQYGLLLTPELVQAALPNDPENPFCIFQQRISFTELAPSELQQHAETFGAFAIEFEIEKLLQIGALPVFYFPVQSPAIPMFRLLDGLMKNQQLIESLADSGQPDIPLIHATLAMMLNLFYPTEDTAHNHQPLAYYRQREWRISEPISPALGDTEQLTAEMEEHLFSLDGDFFRRIMDCGPLHPAARIIEHCSFKKYHGGSHILAHARRIIVPMAYLENARASLEEANLDVQVECFERIAG